MRARMLSKAMVWSAFAAVLSVPFIAWLISVRDPGAYLTHALPPGQSLYVFSKLGGLLALFLLWMQCVLALAHRTPILHGFPAISFKAHRRLGLVTVIAVLAHAVLFIMAVALRTGSPAWNLLLPNFAHGYYNSFVSLGLIAGWLLVLGIYAGWRTSRGYMAWKKVHMVWPVVFALAFLHSFTIGSESRYGAMRYVLLLVATSFAAVGLSRALAGWRNWKRSRSIGFLDRTSSKV